MLQSMRSQTVGHDLMTEQQQYCNPLSTIQWTPSVRKRKQDDDKGVGPEFFLCRTSSMLSSRRTTANDPWM